ncbi:MAG TPA: ATP-binding protein, partial [Polyangiaceae bacterium]|nr:ATP-binding protein [Polyangiaceae bacterium]
MDDSPLEAEFAKTILEQQHDVQLFFDGATVIERVTQGILPDVLILDWHMPNVSGLEVCRFLRQSHDEASLPILILTATAGRDDLLEGLAAGANDFVTKEFDSAELVARVATLVRSRRLHDRAKQSELSARRALAVAEQASRAKDVFLATVSHELRNPLNALLGWVTLVARPSVDPALLRRGLEIIERNAKLQVQLIEDILDISRVVSGKLHLETRTVDVARIVQAVVESALPNAESRGLTVQTKLEPSAATVGDPDRLHQAFYNVLSNAMKFSRKGGKIEVSVRRVAEHVEVRIQDEGAGISPEFLPFVFDRFRQQDSTASRNHSGLGLGLALVKSIIEAHGGRVRVTSLGKNRGTTVVLDVPECDVRSSRQPSTETPSSPSAARRSHGQALVGV